MAQIGDDDLMVLDTSSPPAYSSTSVKSHESSLQKVYLSSHAFHFCLTQCLSTEVEEVMGLLIGELDEQNGICHVTHSLPLKRLDKRKDRVEIGTEQLASSFSVVDELTGIRAEEQERSNGANAAGQLQVVGWYHSHPHITVFPSEVDISTHHQYQSTMSPYWLGLIFGVFNYEDAKATNRFQLVAFQSADSSVGSGRSGLSNGAVRPSLKHVIVPIVIEPRQLPIYDNWALKKAATLINLLLEEEKEAIDTNQGEPESAGEKIGKHYNACVYSKAVVKVIALLAAPMVDAMRAQDAVFARLRPKK